MGTEILLAKSRRVADGQSSSLFKQWQDSDWVDINLNLIHLSFWRVHEDDENEAWKYFLFCFLESLAYNQEWLNELFEIVTFFKATLHEDGQRRLEILLNSQHRQASAEAQAALVDEIKTLEERGWLNHPWQQKDHIEIIKWQEAEMLLRQGEYERALQYYRSVQLPLDEVAALRESFADRYLQIGRAMVWPPDKKEQRNFLSAEDAICEALELGFGKDRIKTAEAFYTLATLLRSLLRIEEAMVAASKATDLNDEIFDYWRMLGLVFLDLGQSQQAIAPIIKAIMLRQEEIMLRLKLGQAYYELQQYDKALQIYGEVIQRVPDNPIAYIGMGNVYLMETKERKGREIRLAYLEARSNYERALTFAPQNVICLVNLANTSFLLRKTSEAIRIYEQASQLDANWSYPSLQAGKAYVSLYMKRTPADKQSEYARWQLQQAVDSFTRVLALSEGDTEISRWLGATYFEVQAYQKAEAVYEQELTKTNARADIYYGLGQIHLLQNELVQATESFEKATQLVPERKEFHYYLAVTYYFRGNYEAALKACEMIERLDRYFVPLYCLRGDSYRMKMSYGEAAQGYNQAINLLSKKWIPIGPEIHFRLASTLYLHYILDRSVQAYSTAIETREEWAEAYYGRGLAHYVQGNHREARHDFRHAAKLQAGWAAPYSGLAAVHLHEGDLDQATRYYRQVIKQPSGDNILTHLNLGIIHLVRFVRGNRETAVTHLQQVLEIYARERTPGPGERCCYVLAQFGLGQIPSINRQDWSSDLQTIYQLGGHHYLSNWLDLMQLLTRSKPNVTNVLDDYLPVLQLLIKRAPAHL